MSTLCYNVVRGKSIRATVLDACGTPPVPTTPNAFVTSTGYVSVAYAIEYEDGDDHVQKNANGDLCIIDRSDDKIKRVMATITLCQVDPDLFNLLTNMPVEVDDNGNRVGWRLDDGVATSHFSFELWSGTGGGGACPATNEIQTLSEGGAGLTSFTITFNGQTTASISEAATAAQVQAALELLDLIDPGDIIVTEPTNDPFVFRIEFVGRYAGQNVAQFTATPTGGTGTVTPATLQQGGLISATSQPFGYFGLFHLTNGTIRDFTVENGPTVFEIQAWTVKGSPWGQGPYNVQRESGGAPAALNDVIGPNQHFLQRIVTLAPPAAVCGFQTMPAAPTLP